MNSEQRCPEHPQFITNNAACPECAAASARVGGPTVREPLFPTDEELMAEDRPFERAQARRGGWARVEVGRDLYFGFVREVMLFGAARCEILIPFADKPGVSSRKSFRGRDVYAIEGVSKAEVLEQVASEDEGAP